MLVNFSQFKPQIDRKHLVWHLAKGDFFISTLSSNEWLFLKQFWFHFWPLKNCKYFKAFLRAVHLVFSAFMGFRYIFIRLLITNQFLFLLFVISSSSCRVCLVFRHFLSWLSVLFAFFNFTSFPCSLSSSTHDHVNSQHEGFFSDFFSLPAMDYPWPEMGAMGFPWPSMGALVMSWPSVFCTGVSVLELPGPDSKPHRFRHNSEQKLFWKFRKHL